MSRTYLLFRSTHETMKAEALLQAAGLPCKVVMKPSGIAVDCGLAVRISPDTESAAVAALCDRGLKPRGVFAL